MNRLPQMATISDLRNNHLGVFALLDKGPVVLVNRTQPQGILLSPAQWDKLLTRLEDLEDLVEVLNTELQVERGEIEVETLENQSFAEWVDAERIPA
jgi:PHD/YefM family antitoxin component YafN of YafNO toxin-antitoxin module